MTSITNVNGANIVVQPKGSVQKQLGQSDFLALMTTQLKQQDPFNPVDNQAMVAQMAQFSSLAGMNEMNDTMKLISAKLGDQTSVLNDIRSALKSTRTPTTTPAI